MTDTLEARIERLENVVVRLVECMAVLTGDPASPDLAMFVPLELFREVYEAADAAGLIFPASGGE